MSVVLDNALEQYLKTSTVNVSTKPITVAAWVKSDDLVSYQGILSITNDANEWLQIWLRGAVADNYAAALEYATAWKRAVSTTPYTTGNWHHICGVFKNSVSRTIHIDGGSSGENTESQDVNFTLFDQILIGTYKTVTTAFFSGKLAHCSIWDTDLSEAQIISLAAGASPNSVQAENLVDYWSLVANANSEINDNHLTAYNDPTFDDSDNPEIYSFNYPQKNIVTIKRLVVAGNDEIWFEDL